MGWEGAVKSLEGLHEPYRHGSHFTLGTGSQIFKG